MSLMIIIDWFGILHCYNWGAMSWLRQYFLCGAAQKSEVVSKLMLMGQLFIVGILCNEMDVITFVFGFFPTGKSGSFTEK